MSGSSRKIAEEFKRKQGTNVTHITVAKIFVKLKKNGTVENPRRSGRPRTATDENTTARVLKVLTQSPPKKITRRLSVKIELVNQVSLAFKKQVSFILTDYNSCTI